MTRVVRGVSLLFSGLFAGFLLCVLVLENSLRGFDASVYTQVRLVELDRLDTLASVTLIPAISKILMAREVITTRKAAAYFTTVWE